VFFKSQQAAAMAASTQIYGEDTAKFQVRLYCLNYRSDLI